MAEGEERPGEERPSGGGDDEKGKYPIGFRFKPTPEELVEFYLLPKLQDQPTVPNENVIVADAYGCHPETLTEKYKERGVDGDDWYFLSPRLRRYPGGDRPTRRTADNLGRWKPSTGQSQPEDDDSAKTRRRHSKAKAKKKPNVVCGIPFTENTLAYYVGLPKNETKTKWLMHELVVPKPPENAGLPSTSTAAATKPTSNDMLLNKYVICWIYKSPLRKWKGLDGDGSTSSACEEEVPATSPQPPWSAPGSVGEAEARAPSRGRACKRPAVERRRGRHTGAPNTPAPPATLLPDGQRLAPTYGSGGVGGVRMPAGVGAAGTYHGVSGLPPLVHWPPAYSGMQGPVQLQQPPSLMYGYNNRAVGMPQPNGQEPRQAPPVLLRPPHWAAATAPNSPRPTMMTMMRPPNLPAAGQPARQPSPRQQQQQQQQQTEMEERNRVYAKLIAEMKLQRAQQGSAGQRQQIRQTASTQPAACLDGDGGKHPAGVEAMVPPAQFPAPHNRYPYNISCSLAEPTQRQQSSSATTPEAAETPAAENVPSNKQSVPRGANEGSGKGDATAVAELLQILEIDFADTNN